MNLITDTYIAEEDFQRKFVNTLMYELREASALSKDSFEITVVSSKPHWTGGYGHATEDEMFVAKNIVKKLLRYFDTPYNVSFPEFTTFPILFSTEDLPEKYDPFEVFPF